MAKWMIETANKGFIVEGKTLREAVRKKSESLDITKIVTGYLVRVKQIEPKPDKLWGYWDCREFWKALGAKSKLKKSDNKP